MRRRIEITADALARVYAAAYAGAEVQINDARRTPPEIARNSAETAVHHFVGVLKDVQL